MVLCICLSVVQLLTILWNQNFRDGKKRAKTGTVPNPVSFKGVKTETEIKDFIVI